MDKDALVKQRFWAKVDCSSECWRWRGGVTRDGYGVFWVPDGTFLRLPPGFRGAHRVAYELEKEPIPIGLEVHHVCSVPACVNPSHLEVVSHSENLQRRPLEKRRRQITRGRPRLRNAATHCRAGHEYTSETTYLYRNGQRTCLACKRITNREAQRRRRARVQTNNG